MSNLPVVFELYRYQLLPIDRYLQGNFLTGISSVEELINRKNELFADAIKNTNSFSGKTNDTITKKLYEDNDFFLFKVARNKSIHRETKDFRDEKIDHWPSILVAIWNHPEKQLIAVQRRTTAFSSSEVAVNMIIKAISNNLSYYHLRAIPEALFEKQHFWSLIELYKGQVKALEFEIITPNMANISGSLTEDLKSFAKTTNSTRNKIKIESDPEATLHLDETNPTLQGLVDYSSQGGGNISLKVEGIKKKINTSRTVKEVCIENLEFEGGADKVASTLKELLG